MTKSKGIYVRRGTRIAWAAENQGRYVCQCGCEEPIPLKPVHYGDPPKYLHGHNGRGVTLKPKPPARPCECGCGRLATPGRRFLSGHNGAPRSAETRAKLSAQKTGERNPQYGKTPHNFKGRYQIAAGYWMVHLPDHPLSTVRGTIAEHRLVMERHLLATDPGSTFLVTIDGQRVLSPSYEVHHDNEDKGDNRIENLQVVTPSEHKAIHMRLRHQRGQV